MKKSNEKNRCVVFYEGETDEYKNMKLDFNHIEYLRWYNFHLKDIWKWKDRPSRSWSDGTDIGAIF